MINELVQASVWILLPFGAGMALGMVFMAIAVNMMRKDDEEMECERCEVVEMCRKMFGKYWNDKSDGGTGCKELLKDAVVSNPPMSSAPPEWRQKELLLAAGAMENPETESLNAGASGKGEYVPRAGEVEILAKPHAAPCGGNRADAGTSDASRKIQPDRNSTTRDAVGPGHGKPTFIQEMLL